MSCSKWRWTEACDGRPCPGDCDLCRYFPEGEAVDHVRENTERWVISIEAPSGFKFGASFICFRYVDITDAVRELIQGSTDKLIRFATNNRECLRPKEVKDETD